MDAENLAQDIPSSIQHVVVMCDGTPGGDRALRLANAISQSTGASVRAVTWLPVGYALDGDAPIENFLASVTRQLYRVTTMVGFWRLELLTGRIDHRLAQLCLREAAALLIVPCAAAESLASRWTLTTGIPVACVRGEDVTLRRAGHPLHARRRQKPAPCPLHGCNRHSCAHDESRVRRSIYQTSLSLRAGPSCADAASLFRRRPLFVE